MAAVRAGSSAPAPAQAPAQANAPQAATPGPVGGIPQEAALRVVKGSLGASTVSAAIGSVQGVLRAEPAMLRASTFALNTFSFAFPFFGLREYVVNPLLADAIASWRQHDDAHAQAPASLHTRNLLSSAISGTLVGGGLAGYLRGRSSILGGARTFGLACTGLQIAGNELRVLRVMVLTSSWFGTGDDERPTHQRADVSAGGDTAAAGTGSASSAAETPAHADGGTAQSQSLPGQLWGALKSLSPVKRITEEEYEARLVKQRGKLAEQMRELDQAIVAEEAHARRV